MRYPGRRAGYSPANYWTLSRKVTVPPSIFIDITRKSSGHRGSRVKTYRALHFLRLKPGPDIYRARAIIKDWVLRRIRQ